MNQKLVFLFVLFAALTIQLSAQSNPVPAPALRAPSAHIYLGLGASLPKGFVLAGGYYSRKGWGGTVSYNQLWPVAKNLPANYDGGGFLWNRQDQLNNEISAVSFRAIKVFNTRSKNIHWGIEAGPSLVRTRIVQELVFDPNPCFIGCGPNYHFKKHESRTTGFSFKGKIDINLPKWMDVEFGFQSNLNPQLSYIGIELLGTIEVLKPH